MKKRTNKLAKELSDVLNKYEDLPKDVRAYVLGLGMVATMVETDPQRELNDMFELIQIACGDAGFRVSLIHPTLH